MLCALCRGKGYIEVKITENDVTDAGCTTNSWTMPFTCYACSGFGWQRVDLTADLDQEYNHRAYPE